MICLACLAQYKKMILCYFFCMNDELSLMERFFVALADKTRLRLLNLLRRDEVCVFFFTEILGENQSKISRHLAFLRSADLVEARRDGKWMHYRIREPENEYFRQILSDTLKWLASQPEMKQDYENLTRIYRLPTLNASDTRAPEPDILRKTNMLRKKRELETFLL